VLTAEDLGGQHGVVVQRDVAAADGAVDRGGMRQCYPKVRLLHHHYVILATMKQA
jgi:hypothetical protein